MAKTYIHIHIYIHIHTYRNIHIYDSQKDVIMMSVLSLGEPYDVETA